LRGYYSGVKKSFKKRQKKVWWKEKIFIFAAPYEGKEKEVHRKIENIPKTKKQSKYPILDIKRLTSRKSQ
jgi:hypothetical protein